MSKHQFSYDLPARIKNMDETILLLKRERDLLKNKLISSKPVNDDEELQAIRWKKKIIRLTQEILSKTDFVKKLRDKMGQDEKEMKSRIIEANTYYKGICKKAEEFLEKNEQEKGNLSRAANMVQYLMNEMIIAKEEKNDPMLAFYYNALKKELTLQQPKPEVSLKVEE